MNRRIKSISLMSSLQPFMQGGIISAGKAKEIVDAYLKGDDAPLSSFATDPSLPMQYLNLSTSLKSFIQGGTR